MLKLSDQATNIVTRLKTITELAQVDYLESAEDMSRRPFVLPLAQLALSQATLTKPANRTTQVETSWMVMISAKDMVGASGLMSLVDDVLDSLSGFTALSGTLPLYPATVAYTERFGEAATYVITFTTAQTVKYGITHT